MDEKFSVSLIPMEDCHTNDWNPNVQSELIYEKTKASLLQFGFVDPVKTRTVDRHKELIDGEHRWRVIREIIDDVAILTSDERDLYEQANAVDNAIPLITLVEDESIPIIDLGDVSQSDAKQLTVVLNNTRGESDTLKLAELLVDLDNDIGIDDLKAIMPFPEDELTSLLALPDFDWNQLENEEDEPEEEQSGDQWVLFKFRVPSTVAPIVESEIERIGDVLELKEELSDEVRRGLILEAICVNSSTTPVESVK